PEGIELYGRRIRWRELNHPGRAFGYRVDEGDRSFGYITDIELREQDFEKSVENKKFFEGLDAMILDTQYTLDEAIEKHDWGHSSFSLGVDFAVAWNISNMYMFHHEPLYSDKKLDQNLQSARWYAKRIGGNTLEIELATEGVTIDVG
ncbi:MAG: MBL fold metallo-hydrolase, partial [Alkalispirochaeta sp.]